MKSKLIDIEKNFSQALELAGNLLKSGEIIAFPTDTVYGLGADIFNEKPVRQIFEVKRRRLNNPLSAHLSDIKDVEKLCKNIPESFYQLAEKFLPGPLTIVLPKKDNVPDIVTGGLNSLGIRIPDNKFVRTLIRETGIYIAGTSANLSGGQVPNTTEVIIRELGDRSFYIFESGATKHRTASTVIDLSKVQPELIRKGTVKRTEIENTINKKLLNA